jgi:hypothetical protein
MITYCFDENNIDNERCQSWLKTRTSTNAECDKQIYDTMKIYCGNNFNGKLCQSWCTQVRDTNGKEDSCDDALQKYCKVNSNDIRCKCVNTTSANISSLGLASNISQVCWLQECGGINRQTMKKNIFIPWSFMNASCPANSERCYIDPNTATADDPFNSMKDIDKKRCQTAYSLIYQRPSGTAVNATSSKTTASTFNVATNTDSHNETADDQNSSPSPPPSSPPPSSPSPLPPTEFSIFGLNKAQSIGTLIGIIICVLAICSFCIFLIKKRS